MCTHMTSKAPRRGRTAQKPSAIAFAVTVSLITTRHCHGQMSPSQGPARSRRTGELERAAGSAPDQSHRMSHCWWRRGSPGPRQQPMTVPVHATRDEVIRVQGERRRGAFAVAGAPPSKPSTGGGRGHAADCSAFCHPSSRGSVREDSRAGGLECPPLAQCRAARRCSPCTASLTC
jgi:hypothetical protein